MLYEGPPNSTSKSTKKKKKKKEKILCQVMSIVEIEGALAPETSKFTKVLKFQKNVYANLRLLNTYGLIISIKTK